MCASFSVFYRVLPSRELFDLKGRIKGLDSKVNNAKSCDGSLGLLRVQISMTEGWIMVHGKSRDVIT